ncbi:MAG: HD domain-containing protein [Clostridium sp.]|nr:HD domain-containing protein [Acetatifactor muris]MCM1526584.1 HD domain-containing protein [Bacteroides sp.]MCM1562290.1 HD domain-containing protein [Clostridium sp.]
MKDVAWISLTPGMVLGADIISQDKVIYPAGTELNQLIIDKLKRYSVMCATVMEDIDFASTHYERIRFNEDFKLFEQNYNAALLRYKLMMGAFLETGTPVKDADLLRLYNEVYVNIPSGAVLLDFLYNMMPNEDELTFSHCLNSALLAGAIADWLNMNDVDKRTLILCGFYYDIGKMKLPYDLLWKSGKLTPEEFKIIQTHPVVGYSLVRGLDLDPHIKNAVIMHHERLDGSGYPYHMQGQKIDVFARYMAIVDAYIAMASPRSYRNAFTPLQILGHFEENMYRFDVELLMPIMQRIADAQIGSRVQTNDERIWEVLIIHPTKYSRPLLKSEDNNELVDLLRTPGLEIVKMV